MKSICEPDIRCIAMQVTVFPVMRENTGKDAKMGASFSICWKDIRSWDCTCLVMTKS